MARAQAMFPAPGELVVPPEQQVKLTEAQELLAQQQDALPASWSTHSEGSPTLVCSLSC